MESHTHDLLLELRRLFERLNTEIGLVLVEGKRDRRALQANGFANRIMDTSSLPISEIADRVVASGEKNVVVLTDFDSYGRKRFGEISGALAGRGIRLKNIYREKIKEILDTENMKTIESLSNLKKRLDDANGSKKRIKAGKGCKAACKKGSC